ncbi:uncharacterized protein LOC106883807 [Octopus bimaculoides]|nr:uncharacterized protein LOC106883807 [Octopus bimaculoides]|eukprot:XP_014790430.1 PREDICTED: uncharacterized protein LOC106883807 isoform X2 [Octopus bimaculoides]
MSFTDDWFEENILIKWNNILEKQEYIEFLLQKISLKNPGDKPSASTSIYKEVLSNLDGCYNCLVAVIKVLKYSVDASKTKDEGSTDNKNEHHTSLSESDPSIDLISQTSAQLTNESASEYKPQSQCEPQSKPSDLLQKLDLVSVECPTKSDTLTNSIKKVAPSLHCGNSFKEENYGLGPDLKELTLSSTVKVSVCIVMSPYCFWVQLTDTAESNLIQLAKDISEHISSENCRRIRQPFVGMKCLAPYNDGCFYRAKIVNICKPNKEDPCKLTKVNVLYVDYGNTEVVSSGSLQEIPYSLSQLPCQAICCSLANIAPVDIKNDWSINISDIFQKLVSYSVLLCIPKISCTDGFPHLVHLYPIDFPSASALQLYSISLQLISKNCAVYIPISEQINLICNILKTWVLFNQQPVLDSTEEDSISVTSYRNDDITKRQYYDGNINQQIRSAFTKRMECSTIYEEPCEDFEEENCLNVNVADQCEHSTSQTSPEKLNYQISSEMSNCQTKPKICNSQTSPEKSLSESSTLPCTNVTTDNKEGTLESCSSEPLPKQFQTTDTSIKKYNTSNSETEKIHEVVFSYVSTPSDFYVYVINSATIERLADLVQSLNEKFLRLKPTELLELSETLKIEINSLCCCYDKTDQSYHRGIIIDFKSAQKPNKMSVKVFYIDYGYIAWISRKHIYPMNIAYKKFPALAVHCTLARICPVGQKPHPSDTYIWPEKAKKAFKKNINFKDSYVMKIVSGNLPSTSFSFQQYLSPPLQVLIATLSDKKTESVQNAEICINYELVRLNHATLTEKSAELELLNWDPMSVDYASLRNRYEINTDDAQIATQGFMVNDEKTICKFYRDGQKCKLGSKCPYKHIRVPDDCLTVDKREVVCKDDSCSEFELPLVGSLVGVEVSAIINPAHFYLILPWGKDAIKDLHDMPDYQNKEETLADLQKDLQDFYKLSFPKAEENLFWGIGELVAAQAVVDQDWYRARICEVNDVINEVKVFFIDFGNVQWIPESNIQSLAPQFTHLPHQSVECCLNGIVSASDNGLWTQEAKDYFLELVDDKVLVASIKAIMCRRMYIDLYDTYQIPEKNIADELIHAGVAKRNLSADENLSTASNLTISKNYIPG